MKEKIDPKANFAKEEGVFVIVGKFLRHKNDYKRCRPSRHFFQMYKTYRKGKRANNKRGGKEFIRKRIYLIVKGCIKNTNRKGKDFARVHSAVIANKRDKEKSKRCGASNDGCDNILFLGF